MTVRVVKISRPVIDDRPWRVEDESGEINEAIELNDEIKDWVGGRPYCYLKAVRTVDGWKIKSRWKGRPLYW